MEAVSLSVPLIADTTNTSAASVKATARAISRTERRMRSAMGPDWNLRVIMGANLRNPKR